MSSAAASRRIVPLLDRLLVRKMRPLEKTASGILLPEKAVASGIHRGEVLAVGPGTQEHKMALKVGDKVLLPQFGGQVIRFEEGIDAVLGPTLVAKEGEELVLFRESEILAKLQDQ